MRGAGISISVRRRSCRTPRADAALISIRRMSPEVVRDDKCEALGGLERRTAGSRVADNTQQGAPLISMVRAY